MCVNLGLGYAQAPADFKMSYRGLTIPNSGGTSRDRLGASAWLAPIDYIYLNQKGYVTPSERFRVTANN